MKRFMNAINCALTILHNPKRLALKLLKAHSNKRTVINEVSPHQL